MTGRGVDQILPCPSNPILHEPHVRSALEYLELAEYRNGAIQKPVGFSYIWGDALADFSNPAHAARIVNLETSVTTCDDYEPKGINYRMHPANVPCLSSARIDCCVLANNHVMDWGRQGLRETLTSLQRAAIKTAGAGRTKAEAMQPAIMHSAGPARALLFAACTPDSGVPLEWEATDRELGVNLLHDLSDRSIDHISEQIRGWKRENDLSVFSIHWGGNWGYEVPQRQQDFAHKLIDYARVDLVHGHSSHHPKGIEVYRNKLILYGCGDFLDDYEGIAGYEEYRGDLVLLYIAKLDPISGELLALEMSPFKIRQFQLHRASHDDVQWLRQTLNREGNRFGTRVASRTDRRLALQWK